MNTNELKKLLKEKHIIIPSDLHKIKDIDREDMEKLAKILGMELPKCVSQILEYELIHLILLTYYFFNLRNLNNYYLTCKLNFISIFRIF